MTLLRSRHPNQKQPPHTQARIKTKLTTWLNLRVTLFWRLFLSLLIMLLITSVLSITIERYLNTQQINSRMQLQVENLLEARQQISHLVQIGDFNSIRQRYRQDRQLMRQVRLLNEQGEVIFPKFRHQSKRSRSSSERNLNNDVNNRNHTDRFDNGLRQQITITKEDYPELTDITVLSPDGHTYVIQLQPYLPLYEVRALRRRYTAIRIGVIVLFSVLVCYWFSRTLTRRIRKLQQAVHHISEGSYQNDTILTELGDDELGMLAKEVAQLSNRLYESENARRRMLSDISHELRSPLARLDVATELTRDFAPEANGYIERIEKESGRMNHLIDQIIHIQSLQMTSYNAHTDNSELVDILALLEGIKEDVCFEFQNKKVRWQWSSATDNTKRDSHTVLGDSEQLYSAFENIIRNAFEHTDENSTVNVSINKISLTTNSSGLKVEIMDRGDGISDPTDLERIVQPFVRLSASRSRHTKNSANQLSNENKSTGYGLGLAISHAVITAHNGTINAYNRDDGISGLIVEVVLPSTLL